METKKVVVLNEDGTVNEKETAKQEIKNFLQNVKSECGEMVKKSWDFTMNNKENLMFLVGLGGAAITTIKKANRYKNDRYTADNSIWDPVTHTRFMLRRPLTNRERLEYVRRTRNGEYADEVLESMGVLRIY